METNYDIMMATIANDMITTFIVACALGIIIGMVVGALIAIDYVGFWKSYKKAGQSGWKCLIPFYNQYISYKISWKTERYFAYLSANVLAIVFSIIGKNVYGVANVIMNILSIASTIVALVFYIIRSVKFAKAYGKGVGFGIGIILLEPIFMAILGLGKAEYVGAQTEKK